MPDDLNFDDLDLWERPDLRLCACGCSAAEHDDAGRCRFCGAEDCCGFTYDEEMTMLAVAAPEKSDA
jgi:hypothetical protein